MTKAGSVAAQSPLVLHTVAMRVFTTSLGGKEDVATGGAVAGLTAVLTAENPQLKLTSRCLSVEQGRGGPETRGRLLLEIKDGVKVGGRVRLVGQPETLSTAFFSR
jgi:predicted PhzF superfamily epimerase YddE/YHI9